MTRFIGSPPSSDSLVLTDHVQVDKIHCQAISVGATHASHCATTTPRVGRSHGHFEDPKQTETELDHVERCANTLATKVTKTQIKTRGISHPCSTMCNINWSPHNFGKLRLVGGGFVGDGVV